jgi:hypothetical protein
MSQERSSICSDLYTFKTLVSRLRPQLDRLITSAAPTDLDELKRTMGQINALPYFSQIDQFANLFENLVNEVIMKWRYDLQAAGLRMSDSSFRIDIRNLRAHINFSGRIDFTELIKVNPSLAGHFPNMIKGMNGTTLVLSPEMDHVDHLENVTWIEITSPNFSALKLNKINSLTHEGKGGVLNMPKLEEAVKCESLAQKIFLPRLNDAAEIQFPHATQINLDSFRAVVFGDGDFSIPMVEDVFLPQFEYLEGNFIVTSAKKINCPQFVGRQRKEKSCSLDLPAAEDAKFESLKTVSVLNIPKLRDDIPFRQAFPSLRTIKGVVDYEAGNYGTCLVVKNEARKREIEKLMAAGELEVFGTIEVAEK